MEKKGEREKKRVQGRNAFSLLKVLDREEIEKGSIPRNQKPRVRQLCRAGTQIFLVKGIRSQGSYHKKEVIVDRRWMFEGSANLTDASHGNRESAYFHTGTVVKAVLQDNENDKQVGTLWKG